jgi:hypothetical protein
MTDPVATYRQAMIEYDAASKEASALVKSINSFAEIIKYGSGNNFMASHYGAKIANQRP